MTLRPCVLFTAHWSAQTWNTAQWCGPHKRNIDNLERVERRETKFILKGDDPYDIRLKKLNLLSLEKRRSLTDVTFLYKVFNGNIDIDISKITDFHSEADRFSLRSKDFLTLKKKYARTNVLKYSFFHRITDQWNQLPLDIRVSDNVNIYKSRVKWFLSSFYISTYFLNYYFIVFLYTFRWSVVISGLGLLYSSSFGFCSLITSC